MFYKYHNCYLEIKIHNKVLENACKLFFIDYKSLSTIPEYAISYSINMYVSKQKSKTVSIYRNTTVDEFFCKSMASSLRYNMDNNIVDCCFDSNDLINETLIYNLLSFFMTELLTRIFMKKNIYPIHASALSDKINSFLFIGNPGAGKTTTMLQLLNTGYSLLSDDRPLLDKKGNVYSFYRPVNVSVDMLPFLSNMFIHMKNIYIKSEVKKISVPISSFQDNITDNYLPLKKIIVLENNQNSLVNKMTKMESMQKIVAISFPYYSKNEIKYLMEMCAYLIENIPFYSIKTEYSSTWIETVISVLKGDD